MPIVLSDEVRRSARVLNHRETHLCARARSQDDAEPRYKIMWGDDKSEKNRALLTQLSTIGADVFRSQKTLPGKTTRKVFWEEPTDGVLTQLKKFSCFSDVAQFPTDYLTIYNHANKLLDKHAHLTSTRTNTGPTSEADDNGNSEPYGEFEQLIVDLLTLRSDVKEEETASSSARKAVREESAAGKKLREEAVRNTYGNMSDQTLQARAVEGVAGLGYVCSRCVL